MQKPARRFLLGSWFVGWILAGLAGPSWAGEPVAMRINSFTVAPAHTPLAVVMVQNTSGEPFHGTLRVRGPEGWRIVPAEMGLSVPAGGVGRAAFTVQRGTILEANSYPMEVTATAGGATIVHKQNVVCASAPYFRPKIDGNPDDWKDAIPVTFVTAGKKTAVSTFWNRRQFAVLVAVEEDRLVPWREEAPKEPHDALQLAISPDDTPTPASPDGPAGRAEFLVVAAGTQQKEGCWKARCFRLAGPATKLAETQQARDLASLTLAGMEAVVSRKGNVTYYECAIPLKLLDRIKASEGREFCFSVLVHDPDGSGLRDWGRAAGLWPTQRNRLAWSDWPGARWGKDPPLDNKTTWGLCSSKY